MNNEWLKNLKVGDEVIVRARWGEKVCRVEKITPTRMIDAGGRRFNSNGTERGRDVWDGCDLREATPEAKQGIYERAIIEKARDAMRGVPKLTYQQAVEILKILEVEE